MPLYNKKITEREKAALYYHVFAGLDDWKLIYKIADATTDNGEIKYLDTYVSKWKNSDKVKAYLQVIQKQKADQDADERNKGKQEERRNQETREDSERTQTKPEPAQTKIIDYSDPKNRQLLYNTVIANSKDDPKTQLDAAKMFEQIQKDDREAAKAQKQSRIYLPLRCENCALYLKASKKTTK